KIAASGLREKVEKLLALLSEDPFKSPPPYKKLMGDLSGAYSRRINRNVSIKMRHWLREFSVANSRFPDLVSAD
ncbi:MAG: hypothetical protein EHM27_09970, partial [Deltaproteobacteria bacterium]